MIEALMTILIFLTLLAVTVHLYMSTVAFPRPVQKQAPQVSVDRINYLYHNDYQNFLKVKKDLEERGWRIIFIKNETLS